MPTDKCWTVCHFARSEYRPFASRRKILRTPRRRTCFIHRPREPDISELSELTPGKESFSASLSILDASTPVSDPTALQKIGQLEDELSQLRAQIAMIVTLQSQPTAGNYTLRKSWVYRPCNLCFTKRGTLYILGPFWQAYYAGHIGNLTFCVTIISTSIQELGSKQITEKTLFRLDLRRANVRCTQENLNPSMKYKSIQNYR